MFLETLIGKDTNIKSEATNCPSAQQFMNNISMKIAEDHLATGSSPPTTFLSLSQYILEFFLPYATKEVASINAPMQSCALNPLSTHILKEFLQKFLPFITGMCNASLMQGCLPINQRHAIIMPSLRKVGRAQADVTNYRPMSNLTFISKVVERLVCHQLVSFLENHNLILIPQSAYLRSHSTESEILKIVSDVYMAADRVEVTVLGLLYLSAAFDTDDHDILIDRFQSLFGIHVVVLSWIRFFISERTQTVSYAGQQSHNSRVICKSPARNYTGAVLFLLYTSDILGIAQWHGINAQHSYTDDTQVYFHLKSADIRVLELTSCIVWVNSCMTSNRQKLIADEMQFMILGTHQQLTKINRNLIQLARDYTGLPTFDRHKLMFIYTVFST